MKHVSHLRTEAWLLRGLSSLPGELARANARPEPKKRLSYEKQRTVVLFSIGAFGLTMGLVIAAVVAVLVIARPHSCADYGQTLLLLWGVIGVLCLGSTAVVSFGTRRFAAAKRGSWAATAVYGLALLFAYSFIALVLMVAFNC